MNDSCTKRFSDFYGAIGRSVIGDDHFAVDVVFAESAYRFGHADSNGFVLIEARHDN
jgi:hypothetical protein